MKVYVDGVMLINFLVDFMLLLGTNRLSGFSSELYSGVCLLPDFRFLGNLLWRAVCLILMGGIAYGWNRSALQRSGIFLFLSLALGGLAVSIGRNDAWALLLAGGGIWLLGRVSFGYCSGYREYSPMEIRYGDQTVKLLALHDTGNTLYDPITGQQVLVIAASAAMRLTGLTEQQLKDPLKTLSTHTLPGLRLIPFRTVGQTGGMMLAMQFDEVVVDGKRRKALVAFAPENFGGSGAYQALTGGAF